MRVADRNASGVEACDTRASPHPGITGKPAGPARAVSWRRSLIISLLRTSIHMLMLTPVTITIALLCCAFVVAVAYVAIDERA